MIPGLPSDMAISPDVYSLRAVIKKAPNYQDYEEFQSLGYRMPKSHYSWKTLGSIGAVTTTLGPQSFADEASQLLAANWTMFITQGWPVYCLGQQLLRDFTQTDASSLEKIVPEDWKIQLPGFLLVLPENSYKTPDGSPIPYLMISANESDARAREYGEEVRVQVRTAFTSWDGTIWTTSASIHKGKTYTQDRDMGDNPVSTEEHDWLADVRALMLQVVMSLDYLQNLIEIPAEPAAQPANRYARPSRRQQRPLQRSPRWIGRTHTSKIPTATRGTRKGHSLTRPVWRKGHWRNQPHGPQWKYRKLIWLEPTLITPSSEK